MLVATALLKGGLNQMIFRLLFRRSVLLGGLYLNTC